MVGGENQNTESHNSHRDSSGNSTGTSREPVRYHCDYCRKDITKEVRIKCAVCTDFDLCIDCFSVGVEITPHKNNHAYQVMDQLNFSLFSEDWAADEELLLLEAIELYGFGNWIDAADHVATKTAQECEKHYFSVYIDPPTSPLPATKTPLNTPVRNQVRNIVTKKDSKGKSKGTDQDNGQEGEETNTSIVTSATGTGVVVGSLASAPIKPELGGYMPKRNEFEVEYFNDAEVALSDLTISYDDPPELYELKMQVLQYYMIKLEERERKRKFVLEHDLLDIKKIQSNEKLKCKEELLIHYRYMVFMKVCENNFYNNLINGLLAENNLRKRIQELSNYRSKGFTNFSHLEAYLQEKNTTTSDRKSQDKSRQKKIPVSSLYSNEYEISAMKGIEYLSKGEQELVVSQKISVEQYLVIKKTIIHEFSRSISNQKTLKKIKQISKLEPGSIDAIFNFFQKSGWIS